jgi:predicted nucleotidyltransferase
MDNTYKPTIDPSILSPKGDLYPKFWDTETKKLNKNISVKLKQIAEAFVAGFEYPLKIKDIILTGSIANYNWTQYSDVDLHVLVDFSEIPDEYMEAFRDYFDAKKQVWNKTHNISILGHEVELYIQDSNEPHYSTGVYSIMNNKWNTEPTLTKQDIEYEQVSEKTEYFIDQINKISELFAKKDFQKAKAGADNIRQKIKKYRQAGLEDEGEYSTENLVFKMLRNGGYLETLSNLKTQSVDREMGIEEEIFALQSTLEEAKKDACYYKAKAKYKVWPSAYASGYLVRCRKKKGKIKEEELEEEIELDEEMELDEEVLKELSDILDEKKKKNKKSNFSKEKSQGLRGWFSRRGEKGKSKGWIDCNTCRKDKKTGKKTCKACGRGEGEKRSKYPACRPTPSQCTRSGMKRKKSSKQVSWKSKKEE